MRNVLQFMIAMVVALSVLTVPVHAQHSTTENMPSITMEDMFVHPLLAHMSLPDRVGEVSLRVTGFRTRMNGMTQGDYSVHIETALFKRLGLHLRSDGIRYEDFSEIMLQYTVVADEGSHNGVAVFGQFSVPTGMVDSEEYKGLFGVSARFTARNLMVWDGNVHYDPKDKMVEFENAFVFRASASLYPIIEVRGQADNEMTMAYLMPALKFKVNDRSAIGIGFQAAILEMREYDTQGLLSYDFAF